MDKRVNILNSHFSLSGIPYRFHGSEFKEEFTYPTKDIVQFWVPHKSSGPSNFTKSSCICSTLVCVLYKLLEISECAGVLFILLLRLIWRIHKLFSYFMWPLLQPVLPLYISVDLSFQIRCTSLIISLFPCYFSAIYDRVRLDPRLFILLYLTTSLPIQSLSPPVTICVNL